MNYYNEFDPHAAAWLEELIKLKSIPTGIVDQRDIREVHPNEIKEFTQCHFFAGIGGWSHALSLAGWREDSPVWTGSCPCQPFSGAGKHLGNDDERHLWPAFFALIAKCHPNHVFGEQVASAIGKGWLDGISTDLEAEGYALGAVVLGAHSLGSPHRRQRLFWVADSSGGQREQRLRACGDGLQRPSDNGPTGGMANMQRTGLEGLAGDGTGSIRQVGKIPQSNRPACPNGTTGGLGNAEGDNQRGQRQPGEVSRQSIPHRGSGAWGNYELTYCRDGKARRIESGTFPLVAGLPKGMVYGGNPGIPINPQATAEGRVMRLRGYGNSIVPQVGAEFIRAFQFLESQGGE